MSTIKHATIYQHSEDWEPRGSRDIGIFTSSHKGYEAVVISQLVPTADQGQLVEVEIDRHKLDEVIEALLSLQSFLSPLEL